MIPDLYMCAMPCSHMHACTDMLVNGKEQVALTRQQLQTDTLSANQRNKQKSV